MAGAESLGSMGAPAAALGRGAEMSAVATAVAAPAATSLASYDVMSVASAIVGNLLDSPTLSSTDVLSQANAVASEALSNMSSPLDGVEAAMHSAAREAWAATEPAVQVFSPTQTALYTALYAQNSTPSTPTETKINVVPAEVTALLGFIASEANRDLSITVPTSPIEQALALDTMPTSLAPMPIELPSVQRKSEIGQPEETVSVVTGEKAVVSVVAASDVVVAENITLLAKDLGIQLNSQTQRMVTLAMTASEDMISLEEGTDETPVPGVAVHEEQLAAQPGVTMQESPEVVAGDEVWEEVLLIDQEVTAARKVQKNDLNDNPQADKVGFEEDEVANAERRKVAEQSYTIAMQQEGEVPDQVLAQRVVDGFISGLAENDKADSEIVRGTKADETKLYWIPEQVERAKPSTPTEALYAIKTAIGDNTGVRRGQDKLGQREVDKVFEGGIRRRVIVSSLAA